MTPRKMDRSCGVGCWYIIILVRRSEAKTCIMHDAGKEYHLGPYLRLILRSLSNVDGDGNENGKKQ